MGTPTISPFSKQQLDESQGDYFINNDFVASNVENVVTHYNEHER